MKLLLSALASLFCFFTMAQNVAINNDNSTAHASAMLHVKSTTKGLLIPRMASTERTAIAAPANGLLVFDNTTNTFWYYQTNAWKEMVLNYSHKDSTWSKFGNSGINSATQFIGNTDSTDLVFRTNNTNRFRIKGNGNVGIGLASPTAPLEVDGKIKTTAFQLTDNPAADKILRSDINGNASWVNSANVETDPKVATNTINAVPRFNNTELVDGSIKDNGNIVSIGGPVESNISFRLYGDAKMDTVVTNRFQLTTGAGLNKILQSDAAGVASWVSPTAANTDDSWKLGGNNNTLSSSAIGSLNRDTLNFKAGGNLAMRLMANSAMDVTNPKNNVQIGTQATTITGIENTMVGINAGFRIRSGDGNTAFGYQALNSNSTQSGNTAIGAYALGFIYTSDPSSVRYYNTAVGYNAMHYATSADSAIAVGVNAAPNYGAGSNSIFIGANAAPTYVNGNNTIAIGANAMKTITIGNDNTFIGSNTGSNTNNIRNSTAIGAYATVNANNTIILGDTTGNQQIGINVSKVGDYGIYAGSISLHHNKTGSILYRTATNSTGHSNFSTIYENAEGTLKNPLPFGGTLQNYQFKVYDGNNYVDAASMLFEMNGLIPNNNATSTFKIKLRTPADTVPKTRFDMNGDGNILLPGPVSSYSLVKLHVGGAIALADDSAKNILTTDNQFVPIGNYSVIRMSSNSTDPLTRNAILGDGVNNGQLLYIVSNAAPSNQFRIIDITGNTKSGGGKTFGANDVAQYVWRHPYWYLVSFSDN